MKQSKTKSMSIFFLVILLIASFGLAAIKGVNVGSKTFGNVKSQIRQGLDLKGGFYVVYEAETDATGDELNRIMDQTIAVFRKRVDAMGLTEPSIVREGEKRVRIELPGVKNAEEAMTSIGKTAQLMFVKEDGSVVLTGKEVKDSQVAVDPKTQIPVVTLEFNDEGTKAFAEATAELAPTKGKIMIILDDQLISAPSVQSPIPNGNAEINGDFTYESASTLSSLIRGGALPVNFKEIESSVTTATLGDKALQNSIKGALLGILLVMLLMLAVYRLPGFIADIALVAYMLIVAYVYAALHATLTLPGIAAAILSVGMAVDANVIIFERIKEEMRKGKSIRISIESGFSKALSTILDSQITTFIAGVVLYYFGTGPIKGFALTLMIGILASIFTAVFITKLLLKSFINAFHITKAEYFGVKVGMDKESKLFDFMGKKKIFFSISAIVIIIGLATSTFSGLNYGIDFTGGTTMGINLGKYVETTEIREITNEIDPTMSINYLGENKDSVELKTIKDLDNAERKAVFEKFKTKYNLTDDAFYKSSQFGPTVGKEIKHKAFTSVAIATLCMLLYVSFRFQLAYGIAAIIALLHDVLVVFAVYAVLRIPLNSPFVAAMLTVVGYSINDTIVIFDRVREELGGRRSNLEEVVNKSISQTLKRSINTSLTTLLAILSLYIMGVESIREFTLPLLAGITVGTYSSVCIAGSLWVILTKKLRKA